MDVLDKIKHLSAKPSLDEDTKSLLTKIDDSIQVLLKTIEEYGEDVALSFNGGKDCTVALHLLRAACAIKDSKITEQSQSSESGGQLQRIKFVHFVKPNEFLDIEKFREQIEQMYNIKVQLFSADFKGEVQKLIDTENIKAIIMGNRRSDPWSRDLEPICKSSPGWPDFYRVFPILDWSYRHIWSFLRIFELPYCSLYDQGYTSLGELDNTIKNPHLRVEGEASQDTYLPAYSLENEEYERESRVKAK